jgi:hypothetical protein
VVIDNILDDDQSKSIVFELTIVCRDHVDDRDEDKNSSFSACGPLINSAFVLSILSLI